MDGGEYNNNGFSPTPYTPWEKEVMGWTSLTTLEDKAQTVTLKADEARKIESENSDEYIILHNIQDKGLAFRHCEVRTRYVDLPCKLW